MLSVLGVFALWSFAGWIMLGLGISNLRRYRTKEEYERASTTATIVRYVEKVSSYKGHRRTIHFPVLRYEAEGDVFEVQDDFVLEPEKYPVGTELELFYDSGRPADYHLAITPGTTRNAWFLIRFGLVWVLVAFLGVLILYSLSGGYGWDLVYALKTLFGY